MAETTNPTQVAQGHQERDRGPLRGERANQTRALRHLADLDQHHEPNVSQRSFAVWRWLPV